MATIKNATLYLWIYTGQYGSKPAEPNYVLYKEVKTGSEVITFEIAELVKDYIDINFTGNYGSIDQTAWVQWEMTQVYDDDSVVPLKGEYVASTGYGYFEDEVNPLLEQSALISNDIIYTIKGVETPSVGTLDASITTLTSDTTTHTADDGGKSIPSGTNTYLPFLTTENGAYSADFYNGNTLIYKELFGKTVSSITADSTSYTADTDSITVDMFNIAGGDSDIIQYVEIPKGTTRIVITSSDNTIVTKTVKSVDECKYTPYKVSFMNKFGVVQDLWFFKTRKESVAISKGSYLENTLQETSTGVAYSLNRATKIPNQFKVQKSITLNTGFVDEEYNEVIQQLLLTERAWVHENNNVFPIIPSTSSLDYKTKLNDKLINFTIEFEYAYNELNLIK
jgi:hypothetical protein